MAIEKYTLEVRMENSEGIAEFVPMLEELIENIKGGVQREEGKSDISGIRRAWNWAINTVWN